MYVKIMAQNEQAFIMCNILATIIGMINLRRYTHYSALVHLLSQYLVHYLSQSKLFLMHGVVWFWNGIVEIYFKFVHIWFTRKNHMPQYWMISDSDTDMAQLAPQPAWRSWTV